MATIRGSLLVRNLDIYSRCSADNCCSAFERAVHSTKSFVIGLALIEGHLTVEQASDASRVEVLSQIARWGEVEDSTFLPSAFDRLS